MPANIIVGTDIEESKYCPLCGTQVTSDNKFCGSCGATIDEDEKSVKTDTTLSSSQQQTTKQPITHDTTRIYAPQQKQIETRRQILGIIGIVLGVLTLIGFPTIFFTLFYYGSFLLIASPILTIIGIVFSTMTIRSSTAIGAVGLVLNILALLVEIGVGIFILVILLTY
jgi:hypothetical protein